MEMALHEKESERESAPGACACPPADAAHMGAPGRTRGCARAAREVGDHRPRCGGVPGPCRPGEPEGGGVWVSERRGLQSGGLRGHVAGAGGAAPRAVRPAGVQALPAAPCGSGHRLVAGNRSSPPAKRAADQRRGAGRQRACVSSAPGRAPPHLPAPLPWEFVKQISLIAQAEEFVGEKKPGKFPSSGPPLPRFPPGAAGGERAGPSLHPLPPPAPALRKAATPTPAGRSCGVSLGHPCLHGDVPPLDLLGARSPTSPSRPAPGVRRCHLMR